MDPNAFGGLIHLKSLYLSHNKLMTAPDLSCLGESLTTLRLNTFPGDFADIRLATLVILNVLEIQESDLSEVPRNIKDVAHSLSELLLPFNRISQLDNMYGVLFRKLKYLMLASNRISHLSPELLLLPLLSNLGLNLNHLIQLQDISFTTWGTNHTMQWYPSLWMGNNPWHCNGSMRWLERSLCQMSDTLYFVRKSPLFVIPLINCQCHSPVEFKGRPLVSLSKAELQNIELCPHGEFQNMDNWKGSPFCTTFTTAVWPLLRLPWKNEKFLTQTLLLMARVD